MKYKNYITIRNTINLVLDHNLITRMAKFSSRRFSALILLSEICNINGGSMMNWKAFIILRSIIIFKGAKKLFILWLISKPLMNFEFLKSRVKLKLREIEFWKPISRKNAVQMGQTFVSTLNLLCFVLFEEKSFNLKVSPKPSSNSASDCKQNDYILCSTGCPTSILSKVKAYNSKSMHPIPQVSKAKISFMMVHFIY